MVADCHGGLLLLRKGYGYMSRSFVVCDPLTRRYHGIRHPSSDDAEHLRRLNGEDGDISISNFRTFVRYCRNSPHRACVFSTADAGGGWRFLLPSEEKVDPGCNAQLTGRVDGCLYLATTCGCLMVLDNASLVLSEVELPSCMDTSDEVEASYIVVHGDFGPHIGEIEVFGRVHGSGEWILERGVCRLSEATRGLSGFPAEMHFDWALAQVFSDGTRFLVVAVWDRHMDMMDRRWWFFSVDVESMHGDEGGARIGILRGKDFLEKKYVAPAYKVSCLYLLIYFNIGSIF
jgi:hypothetical protein